MIVECPGCQSRYDVTGRPPGTRARCRCGTIFELPKPATTAGALSCPSCGANVAPNAHTCEFCTAALLVKACPRCFAKMFHGSKHCRQCGAKVEVAAATNPDGSAAQRRCPRCTDHQPLLARLVGDVLLDECPGCHGVWLDVAAVERVLDERRQQSATAILGMKPKAGGTAYEPPRGMLYIKCPDCENVMNRVNFGRRSGIIVDVCRNHGTWFDTEELPRVVDFVMKGGLEEAERREVERMREEAKRERQRKSTELAAMTTMSGRAEAQVTLFGGLLGAIGRALLKD